MKNTAGKRSLDEYKALNYPITLFPEAEGGFTVAIKDLPGCITQGETVEEAYEMIEDAKALWLESAYAQGLDIPLPSSTNEYSGKFVLRVPKSLHRQLAEAAEREEVSLNTHVTTLLSQQVALHTVVNTLGDLRVSINRLEERMDGVQWGLPESAQATGAFDVYAQTAFYTTTFGGN